MRDTDGARTAGLAALAGLIAAGGVAILSGAGLSTESGIPDYRGPTGLARRARADDVPDVHRQRRGPAAVLGAQPSRLAAHRARPPRTAATRRWPNWSAAACWPGSSRRTWTACTRPAGAQRRDRAARQPEPGASAWAAASGPPRAELDRRLRAANPGWDAQPGQLNPDGDAVLDDGADGPASRSWTALRCGGVLKPDVIFFGENVPPGPGGRRATSWSTRLPGPGRPRLLADRDVRLPVRPARGQARHPGGDRQPGADPGRRGSARSPWTPRSAATLSALLIGCR